MDRLWRVTLVRTSSQGDINLCLHFHFTKIVPVLRWAAIWAEPSCCLGKGRGGGGAKWGWGQSQWKNIVFVNTILEEGGQFWGLCCLSLIVLGLLYESKQQVVLVQWWVILVQWWVILVQWWVLVLSWIICVRLEIGAVYTLTQSVPTLCSFDF